MGHSRAEGNRGRGGGPIECGAGSDHEEPGRASEVHRKYTELGVATIHSTPAQVGEFIKARSAEVGRILKSVGIGPE